MGNVAEVLVSLLLLLVNVLPGPVVMVVILEIEHICVIGRAIDNMGVVDQENK